MVTFTTVNGTIAFEDPATTRALLEHEQTARMAAEAEQAALGVVYRVSGERDEQRPYGGLLTERLDISERSAYDLIREGKIGYCLCGKKNYRVSERAVRRFEDRLPPQLA